MSDEMDPQRFEALIAAYGATPARWPEEERMAADAFARNDPRAASLLGSSQMRIAYRRSPKMMTLPTPGTRFNASAT